MAEVESGGKLGSLLCVLWKKVMAEVASGGKLDSDCSVSLFKLGL
ncbi:hypothetical protein MtrunA17_Chr1g0186231 [Medicago truncatula]|uniref:Uncharacterized protein n=1 Tax=Medicago truncatula TaxID=3880 RepID=A0A396JTY5_MEDTR|nr:hypothetical protein MtrunA17_Chr1g0186231 [Medicago truncatula]